MDATARKRLRVAGSGRPTTADQQRPDQQPHEQQNQPGWGRAGGPGAGAAPGAAAAADRPLSGVRLFLHGSIPLLQRRLTAIRTRLEQLGASVKAGLTVGVTHVVLSPPAAGAAGAGAGGGSARTALAAKRPPQAQMSVEELLRAAEQLRHQGHELRLVSDAWLDCALTAGAAPPEQQFSLDHLLAGRQQQQQQQVGLQGVPPLMPDLTPAPAPNAPMGRYAQWLGRWEPGFNQITTQVELVLQARFCSSAAALRGPNEAVRAALRELAEYERALGAPGGSAGFNREELNYAHAAAAVRGCSFALGPGMSPAQLQQLLPFVGPHNASIIHQIVATGTCQQLEDFRRDRPVRNSRGQQRPGTDGAATRRRFSLLPGVGSVLAKRWWDAGYRSLDQLRDAAAAAAAAAPPTTPTPAQTPPAGPDGGALLPPSREAAFSLAHHEDLCAPVAPQEVAEIEGRLRLALVEVTEERGWRLELVGGGRRCSSQHDADWLVTHADGRLLRGGLARRLANHLVAAGLAVPEARGFCRIQQGRLERCKEQLREEALQCSADRAYTLDRYDHVWCIWHTAAGALRRVDVVFVPGDHWAAALVAWTGSTTLNRLMRTYASTRGMLLGSHMLMRRVRLAPAQLLRRHEAAAEAEAAATAEGAGPLRGVLEHVARVLRDGGDCVALSVPDEAPPTGRGGGDAWPAGWAPAGEGEGSRGAAGGARAVLRGLVCAGAGIARRVETEADVFSLLGLPFLEPRERNA